MTAFAMLLLTSASFAQTPMHSASDPAAGTEQPSESVTDSPVPPHPVAEQVAFVGPAWYSVGYDRGFAIAPVDPEQTPFSLKFNFQNQLRYTGFARDVKSWTDSAGNVNPVTNRSNFELPRGRLVFSGMALVPEFNYNVNIDYNTVTSNSINFRAFWLSYRFSRALEIFAGQNKVAGSREWLNSSMDTLGVDRSLATTFFRPSLSQGVWMTGEPVISTVRSI